MAVKNEEDKAVTKRDVDLSKGDINLNFQSDELEKYELSAKKAPHNKSVDGKPLDTSKDEYNEASRVGGDEGQEGIKASREKFAKQKDVPSGIASADVGTETIFKSLMQTDAGGQSQVMPEMYQKFSMILSILMSAGSGQSGQPQTSLEAGASPNDYSDLAEGTKNLMISSLTNALSIVTTTYGYKTVVGNFRGILDNNTIKLIPTDFQDVVVSSLLLLYKLVELYGEQKIPYIKPSTKSKGIKSTDQKVINTVTFAYNSILYRKPDQSGLQYWCKAFVVDIDTYNIGTAIYNLVQKFLTSPEYSNVARKRLSVDETYIIMIRMMYLMMFEREGEAAGIKYWQKQFLEYTKTYTVLDSVQKLEVDFNNSAEHKEKTGSKLDLSITANPKDSNIINTITYMYKVILLRDPDKNGLEYWSNYFSAQTSSLDVGTAIYAVASSIKGSKEFVSSGRTITQVQFWEILVKSMYLMVLNRIYDAPGAKYWVEQFGVLIQTLGEVEATKNIAGQFLASQEFKDISKAKAKTKSGLTLTSAPSDYSILTFYSSAEQDPYPGYAKWLTINGTEEFTARGPNLPYFDSPELMVVYLVAYAWKDELSEAIKNGTLNIFMFLIMLNKYARKVEDVHGDIVLGYNSSQDRTNAEAPYNGGPGGGGGNNMLGMLLPILQQMMQQSKSEHLPSSVLDSGKMNKLLQNMERKKTENKRMMNLAESGIAGGQDTQLNSIFNGDVGSMMNQFSNINSKKSSGGKTSDGGSVAPSTAKSNTPTTKYGVQYSGNLEQNITNMYYTILGRAPDTEGFNYWVKYYKDALLGSEINAVTQQIENLFLTSPEYQNISAKKVIVSTTSYDKLITIPGIKGML